MVVETLFIKAKPDLQNYKVKESQHITRDKKMYDSANINEQDAQLESYE
jgi:hypothetical protein